MVTDQARSGKLLPVKSLLDALRDDRSKVTLDIAALELASIEFPGLDQEAFTFRLDHLAEQIARATDAECKRARFHKSCQRAFV